jgi:hypothetical protein
MANHTRLLILLMVGLFSLTGCSTQPKTPSGGPSEGASVSANPPDNASGKPHDVLYLRRVVEPREHAFSLLIPKGWRTEGGILRINPMTMNGAVNTIGAKVDFQVKRDERGTVLMHWLPEMTYKDPRRMGAAGFGFPVGSMYMGMKVYPIIPAFTFLQQVVFPVRLCQAFVS